MVPAVSLDLVPQLISIETSNVFSILKPSIASSIAGDVADEWDGSVDEEPITSIGSYLLVRGAYFNHSCNANLARVLSKSSPWGRTRLVATRDISLGEELCITYLTNLKESKACRTRLLQKYYGFACACVRCSNDSELTAQVCDVCDTLIVTGKPCHLCVPK